MSTFPSHQRAAATHSTRSRCRRGQGTSSDESRRRRAKQSRCQPWWVGRWLGVLISGTPGRSASANSRRCARGATIRDNDRVRLIGRLRLLMVGLVVICGACACDRVSAGRWSESPSATSWPVRPVNTTTPSGPVPPVSEAARAAGLVDVRGVVPDAAIDLRYATANWLDLYERAARANGGEPDAGRRLLSWARAAGFDDVTPTASVWCFATASAREWWGLVWADRILQSDLAHQLVDSGLATAAQLEEISTAWREWAAAPDGWLAIPHGEILCRA